MLWYGSPGFWELLSPESYSLSLVTIFHLLFLKATKVLLIPGPSHLLSPLPLSKHWAPVLNDTYWERSSLTFSSEVWASAHPSIVFSIRASQLLAFAAFTTMYNPFLCFHPLVCHLSPSHDHKLAGTSPDLPTIDRDGPGMQETLDKSLLNKSASTLELQQSRIFIESVQLGAMSQESLFCSIICWYQTGAVSLPWGRV